ncbi:MAG: hypothetical protein HQK49_18105 [Oligoflexia bacterium]|nr:hypothetical protein [Oligoflexia bacterium]
MRCATLSILKNAAPLISEVTPKASTIEVTERMKFLFILGGFVVVVKPS